MFSCLLSPLPLCFLDRDLFLKRPLFSWLLNLKNIIRSNPRALSNWSSSIREQWGHVCPERVLLKVILWIIVAYWVCLKCLFSGYFYWPATHKYAFISRWFRAIRRKIASRKHPKRWHKSKSLLAVSQRENPHKARLSGIMWAATGLWMETGHSQWPSVCFLLHRLFLHLYSKPPIIIQTHKNICL